MPGALGELLLGHADQVPAGPGQRGVEVAPVQLGRHPQHPGVVEQRQHAGELVVAELDQVLGHPAARPHAVEQGLLVAPVRFGLDLGAPALVEGAVSQRGAELLVGHLGRRAVVAGAHPGGLDRIRVERPARFREVPRPRLLPVAQALQVGVGGEVVAHPGLPVAHPLLGDLPGLGRRGRRGAPLVLADLALDRALLLACLVPGAVGRLRRHRGGDTRGERAQRVSAVGVLESGAARLLDTARDPHADGAAVVDGVLDLDLARPVRAVERQDPAFPLAAERALARRGRHRDQVDAGGAQPVGLPLDGGAADRGPHGHLGIAGHLPAPAGLVHEAFQAAVREPLHSALRGLSAGVDAEQRRTGYLADHLPVPVLDASQNAAVRGRDELDGLHGEPVDGAAGRGRLRDARGVDVGQGAELGQAGPGAPVPCLGDDVVHLGGHGRDERGDDTLRRAAQGLHILQLGDGPPGGFEAVGDLPGDDAEQALLGILVQGPHSVGEILGHPRGDRHAITPSTTYTPKLGAGSGTACPVSAWMRATSAATASASHSGLTMRTLVSVLTACACPSRESVCACVWASGATAAPNATVGRSGVSREKPSARSSCSMASTMSATAGDA